MTPAEKAIISESKPFPIVAIGASAGGLDALSILLSNVPDKLGMAYVIIQHLSPAHESILPELLQHKTKMPVQKVEFGMEVFKDHVYVIPPNAMMSIIDGRLTLGPRIKVDGLVHAIDYFFMALASTYQHKAIGIVLSGSGNDGTSGIIAIKAEGGITFVQDESASFHSMPKSAIESGYVDFVLPPEGIARELVSIAHSAYTMLAHNIPVPVEELDIKEIHQLVLKKTGVNFANYKQTTVNRRILRRMSLNKLKSLAEYGHFLRNNNLEIDALYKDLLINVTSFFREPNFFKALGNTVFPEIFRNRKENEPIRIWVPACSTGEEPYSIAITLFEFLKEKSLSTQIQIFATDLNEDAVSKARTAVYSKAVLLNISAIRLKNYFVKVEGGYQVIKPIKDVCIFATHNLLKDPPFSRMDLISCQNVMIYLEANPQKKILQAFHYALKPTGYLLLGKSETVGNSNELFEQMDKDMKFYTKKTSTFNQHFDFSMKQPVFPDNMLPKNEDPNQEQKVVDFDVDKEADKILLSTYVPPSLLVNKDMQIIRFNGATSNYLQPASGKASFQLLKMVREELIFELRALMLRVKKDNQRVRKENVSLMVNDVEKEIDIDVVPLKMTSKEPYFLIIFKDSLTKTYNKKANYTKETAKTISKDRRQALLEQELNEAREHMKTLSEEFDATREELQTANEEVLSSNEELQSINEELETSKEELQSANEELTTINDELQQRNSDLKESVEYSEAIVQTIREPLVVLNKDYRVRFANKAFYRTFKYHQDEVESNIFFEIGNHQFNMLQLKKQLAEVVGKNNYFQNFDIDIDFPGLGKRNLLFNAMRMTGEDQKKDRILLAIQDITERRTAEEELKAKEESFRLLVQNSFDIITIFSAEGIIRFQSESVKRVLGYEPTDNIGKNIFVSPLIHPDDKGLKINMIKSSLEKPGKDVKAEFRLRHKNGQYRIIEAVCISLVDNPRINGVIANYRDVTEKHSQQAQKDQFIGIASHELKTPVTSIKAYTQVLHEVLLETNQDKAAAMVAKMDNQVDRLTKLIKDLLDVTTINEGQLKLREETYDVNELIKSMCEEVQRTSPKHKIVMSLQPVPLIVGDKERITQVLVNILSNAVKYSPDADKIIVSSKTEEDKVVICVEDFGIGIPKAVQSKIFERFFRVSDPSANTYPGLGLGLFISAEIIKRHGGVLTVQSKKNIGSTFCIVLPIRVV